MENNYLLETERILIRRFSFSDLFDFYEYASVEGVGEKAGWNHHKSMEESMFILEKFVDNEEIYALVYRSNKKVIGSIGLHKRTQYKNYNIEETREIGYVLSKDYWGKGLMSEAVKAMIDYAFMKLNLKVLTVGHFVGNEKSKRVIEKCGFKFFEKGVYQAATGTFDDYKYALTKEEYKKLKIK